MSFSLDPKDRHRGAKSVNEKSWHYRLYMWWVSQGGHNRPGYSENLCHYMRVVLVWAPLLWFLKARLYKEVRPWMATLILAFIAMCAIYYASSPNKFIETASFAIFMILLVGFGITVLFISEYMQENGHRKWIGRINKTFRAFFTLVSLPIVAIIIPFMLFNNWTHKRYHRNISGWFFFEGRWKIVYPWSVTVVIALVLSLFIFDVLVILAVVGVFAFWAGVLLGFAFFLIALDNVKDWRNKRKFQHQGNTTIPSGVQPNKETGTWWLIYEFIMAQKNRICPYILLPDDSSEANPST